MKQINRIELKIFYDLWHDEKLLPFFTISNLTNAEQNFRKFAHYAMLQKDMFYDEFDLDFV